MNLEITTCQRIKVIYSELHAISCVLHIPFDSVPKMLASLSNITQTIFPDGGYFSEIVGKKKELLEGLEIPFPETEMDIEYEEDIAAEAEENLD